MSQMGHSLPTRSAPASHDVGNVLKADFLRAHLIELIKERGAHSI